MEYCGLIERRLDAVINPDRRSQLLLVLFVLPSPLQVILASYTDTPEPESPSL
jgi:hypothetical protein